MSNEGGSDFDHECDSNCDCDYDSESAPMAGKISEKNPNFGKEDECKCKEGCETVSCQCFKFGTGCGPACGCTSSCQNMFNDLDHFFGDEKCSANPCFANWLVENKKGKDLKRINCNSLRERIMKSDR